MIIDLILISLLRVKSKLALEHARLVTGDEERYWLVLADTLGRAGNALEELTYIEERNK